MTVLPHAPYSLDLAPADFFLFGHLKQSLRDIRFSSLDEAVKALGEQLSKIQKETWHAAFDDWFL